MKMIPCNEYFVIEFIVNNSVDSFTWRVELKKHPGLGSYSATPYFQLILFTSDY